MSTGRFVTLEGIDGAGKSTHLAALQTLWNGHGLEVVLTREPGGTALAERLRELVLNQTMDGLTEALLVFAGRRDHLQHCIEPALARGAVVLCDRFTDATFAYQGAGRGMPLEVLDTLEGWVQQGRQPDLTLWLDLPAQLAAERRARARAADRFEAEDPAFFERVRAGYAARHEQAPNRVARIDALGTQAEVWQRILEALMQRGWA
jgi:dTMP kinase